MKIEIVKRSAAAMTTIDVPDDATVLFLKQQLHKKYPRLSVARQRLTLEKNKAVTVLEDNSKALSHYGVTNNAQLMLKDLGPQLPFVVVFLVEYLGPLVLYPIFVLWWPSCIYSWWCGKFDANRPLNFTQQLAFFLWMLHFCKREFESVFVHEFGDLTMPVFNIFKNSIYYWGFAIAVSYNVNSPCFVEPTRIHYYIGLPLFFIFMSLNFICHMQLRALRKPGSSEWVMPHGFLFNLVTAPNYLCEILTWVAFNIITGFPLMGVAFNICGAWQMWQWAKDKHRKYNKIFPKYPRSRKVLIPFVL